MRWILTTLFLVFQAVSALAQDDKGLITEYLQDALSDLGREVNITGFRGALSSRATMETLTIADDQGVWLTLTDAELDWNRAALFGGRLEINQISAARIDLPRVPDSENTTSPEAGTFALPELPVSLRIDTISVNQVVLGAEVVGIPVVVSVTGSVALAEGQGTAKLAIARLGGPEGVFQLDAGYSNEVRELAFELSLREAAGGIVANIMNLPDKPALALAIKGAGPIDNFSADVVLESDGQQRLSGRISTLVTPDPGAEDSPMRLIEADIAGDLAPLFAPQYRAFFGDDVALKSRISLFADGRTFLEEMTVTTSALRITGDIALAADKMPEQFQLNMVVQDTGDAAVLLPLSGPETRLQRASIAASFDSRLGNAWSLRGDLQGVQRPDMNFEAIQLIATGVIQPGETRQVSALIDAAARGIGFDDPAMAAALGPDLTVKANIAWREGAPLEVANLKLEAQGLAISGAGSIDGLDSAIEIAGTAQAQITDLARFSDLSGQPLAGQLAAELSGNISVLTGEFDMVLAAKAKDLAVGIASVDTALAGESRLDISALRTLEGITLRAGSISANQNFAQVSGQVATGKSDLSFNAAIADIGQFFDGLNGPAEMSGRMAEDGAGWTAFVDANGPNAINLAAEVIFPRDALPSARLNASIGSVGWIVPGLDGPARLAASLRQIGEQWALNAQADGPGGSALNVVGQIARDAGTASLGLNGKLPLALVNRRLSPNSVQGFAQFDLRLDGPLALSSLSGQARVDGARLSLPEYRNALTEIDAAVTLNGSIAEINASSTLDSGGQLSAQGRIGLQSPLATNIALQMTDLTITDPQLYETKANGALTLSGTLPDNLALAGRVVLGQTEILVPSTGIGSFGEIPPIVHLNEPADVRRTRFFAGLLEAGEADKRGSGSAIGLDVQITAENSVFVRGRGLDAELGGRFRVTGTTADIIPRGRFELIRGRLDILGKRLNLEEGSARLQGGLIPMLYLVARTTSDDSVLSVVVEGPADAPEIRFESVPELPGDEVLARLLFGRDISKISALQAVQLASAVATLAGRGGVGIVERLRQNFGFDDLDLVTDTDGGTSLRIGKYISENAYTDVEIESDGQSRINLNLDLTPSTTLRGQVGTDGSTGIGLFFERDY